MGETSLRSPVLSECKDDKEGYPSDRISLLPDEILITIVSFLPLEEAARTCILSRRWRSVGVSHGNLIFDGIWVNGKRLYSGRKHMMVRQINQVLQSHQGLTVEDFSICFKFNKRFQGHLTRWLQLVSAKLNGIKVFELDFSPFESYHNVSENMSLPALPLFQFSSLTYLSLKGLNLTEDILQGFLNNCLLLESLCLANSNGAVHLKVPATLIRLKNLEIVQGESLRKVEVYSPNLSYFRYYGNKIELFFDKVPQLTSVSIGTWDDTLGFTVNALSSCFAHLKMLALQPKLLGQEFASEQPPHFPAMPALSRLELGIVAKTNFSLLKWAALIVGLPALLTLELGFFLEGENDFNRVTEKPPSHHCSFKTLEIFGFRGYRIDFEFALYLVENAMRLEKLIIHVDEFAPMTKAHNRVMQLKKCLRNGATLELLYPENFCDSSCTTCSCCD